MYWARRRGEHNRLERTAQTRAEGAGGGAAGGGSWVQCALLLDSPTGRRRAPDPSCLLQRYLRAVRRTRLLQSPWRATPVLHAILRSGRVCESQADVAGSLRGSSNPFNSIRELAPVPLAARALLRRHPSRPRCHRQQIPSTEFDGRDRWWERPNQQENIRRLLAFPPRG